MLSLGKLHAPTIEAPLRFDAETGAQGVDVAKRRGATAGEVRWEVSAEAAHSGRYGYLVELPQAFERYDDVRLSLPAFEAVTTSYKVTFWATGKQCKVDSRMKITFDDEDDRTMLDAWAVRPSTQGWRQHSLKVFIERKALSHRISTSILLGTMNCTLLFDDFEITPYA